MREYVTKYEAEILLNLPKIVFTLGQQFVHNMRECGFAEVNFRNAKLEITEKGRQAAILILSKKIA